ncbi:decarboxylase [Stenotrophomonas sp. NA06056]|uniref:decarboxylase n=1 Tax=Stenotrophomonas sp. NA06056 TaxID=2742129 RepID=UPI00158937DF|nr:decarboxylase [Stenotrophomonas sp. NA06056]QKW56516.1 decarboxylase [Stenotrophomonas sp. NA06056]
MTAGSIRGRQNTVKSVAVLSLLCMAATVVAAEPIIAPDADAPVFGAWRNLQTEAGYQPPQRNLAFAMLPQAATRGDRFVILDREGKRAVCCLQVASESLGVAALREQFHLPQAGVTDLSNGRSPARPYLPHVYAMQRVDELADYRFADVAGAYSDLGGLLLPDAAGLAADGSEVRLGEAHYRLQFHRQPLADDDGALDRYTLQVLPAGVPVVVEVPFGTY